MISMKINKIGQGSRVKIVSGKKSAGSPNTNDKVLIEVLENVSDHEKILVNGKVYLAHLPLKVLAGETLVGRILKLDPFTIALDEFSNSLVSKKFNLREILSMLAIEETEISKKIIELLLKKNKPLVKSKIIELINFAEDSNRLYNSDELGLLIEVMWKYSSSNYSKIFKEFEKIFDISFNEISKRIFDLWSNEVGIKGIMNKLEKAIVLHLEKKTGLINLSAVKDKSKLFTEIIFDIRRHIDKYGLNEFDDELITLKKLLLKYILQKSFYANAGIYPEFTVLLRERKPDLYLFEYENIGKGDTESLLGTTFQISSNETSIIGYLTDIRFYGELRTVNSSIVTINQKIKKFNSVMLNFFNLSSNIEVKESGAVEDKVGKYNYRYVANYS